MLSALGNVRASREVWKTIKLDRTGVDYEHAIQQSGMYITPQVSAIIHQLSTTFTPRDVRLVLVTGDDLNFCDGASLGKIFRRAIGSGLALCPPEIGLALRLAYSNQPISEWLAVAMLGFDLPSRQSQVILGLENSAGTLRLCGLNGHPARFWSGEDKFVFLSN